MTLGINGNLQNGHPDKLNPPKPYAGGNLQIKINIKDTQRDFVWRGLYEHAKAAGLSHEESAKFADQWATDKLQYQESGKTLDYTEKEFAELKKKGTTNFDLNKGSPILTDLRERQTAFVSSKIKPQNLNTPSISAPNYTESEKAVKWMTDSIQSVTGTETEVGKQFNRLSVSSLRLMGSLQELKNKANESINGFIKEIAPGSIDKILDDADQINRENAQALKNANTIVTNNDRAEDLYLAKEGIKRPVAEDLHRKMMYFPDPANISNAIDSAVKGDFKADDGTYSDQVGKIIGGLNPAGDVRDIIANTKGVIDGEKGSGIRLGAAIIGAIPGGGDILKPILKKVGKEVLEKSEKELIEQTTEQLVKQGIEKPTAERIAREEIPKIFKETIDKRYDEIARQGHAVQRHGEHLTERQLDDRAMRGIDPVTGTTDDAFRKNPDGTPKSHKPTRNATKFTSKESLVKAEDYVRKSKEYNDAVKAADADGNDYIVVKDIKLENIYGTNYKDEVFGKTRLGTKNNPTGSIETDFTDGTVNAKFYKDSKGDWILDTMYPEPK